MTEKDIRRLSKTDLLTILRDQERELEQLRAEVEALKQSAADRTLRLSDCGSIAEAALELNGVFAAAQSAAEQYLDSVRASCSEAEERAGRLETEARCRADALLAETETVCRRREEESRRQADAYWAGLSTQLESFYESHEGLREMLSGSGLSVCIPGETTRERQE